MFWGLTWKNLLSEYFAESLAVHSMSLDQRQKENAAQSRRLTCLWQGRSSCGIQPSSRRRSEHRTTKIWQVWPLTALNTSGHSLDWMCFGSGSQCRWARKRCFPLSYFLTQKMSQCSWQPAVSRASDEGSQLGDSYSSLSSIRRSCWLLI